MDRLGHFDRNEDMASATRNQKRKQKNPRTRARLPDTGLAPIGRRLTDTEVQRFKLVVGKELERLNLNWTKLYVLGGPAYAKAESDTSGGANFKKALERVQAKPTRTSPRKKLTRRELDAVSQVVGLDFDPLVSAIWGRPYKSPSPSPSGSPLGAVSELLEPPRHTITIRHAITADDWNALNSTAKDEYGEDAWPPSLFVELQKAFAVGCQCALIRSSEDQKERLAGNFDIWPVTEAFTKIAETQPEKLFRHMLPAAVSPNGARFWHFGGIELEPDVSSLLRGRILIRLIREGFMNILANVRPEFPMTIRAVLFESRRGKLEAEPLARLLGFKVVKRGKDMADGWPLYERKFSGREELHAMLDNLPQKLRETIVGRHLND